MITVTKSYLPDISQYNEYIRQVWERGHLTNHGPLVFELEEKVKSYLGVKHCFLVNNGTIALQIALKALEVKGEVITTPFSYVATTSSIVWEGLKPVFADIESNTCCIDPKEIENKISPETKTILATHVYGLPCAVEEIEVVAQKNGINVIYDAAHAFGVRYNGTSIVNYGDISTFSFHATKIFHTIEGGAIVTNNDDLARKISYMRNFGHKGQEDFEGVGINGKMSEFNAAMGLCILGKMPEIIAKRKELSHIYDECITGLELITPSKDNLLEYNYAYYPVFFPNEEILLKVKTRLQSYNIFTRRYFYPSLNKLPYINYEPMPVSESLSLRALCLPLYYNLHEADIRMICSLISQTIKFL